MDLRKHIQDIQGDLIVRAKLIANEFMSSRTGQKRGHDNWSDLVVKIREDKNSLIVEWQYRRWYQTREKRQWKVYLQYLPEKSVVRKSQPWERGEAIWTRNSLAELRDTYRELNRMLTRLDKKGLLGDEAELIGGFVPVNSSFSPVADSNSGKNGGE